MQPPQTFASWATVLAAALLACSGEGMTESVCLTTQPIFWGPSTRHVDLPPEVSGAIGALYWLDEDESLSLLCTVTRVRPGWVLGAAHCFRLEAGEEPDLDSQIAAARIDFSPRLPVASADCRSSDEEPPREPIYQLLEVRLHPTLDLALIAIGDYADTPFVDVTKEAPEAGLELILAGFGWTELDTQGKLRLLPTTLSALGDCTFLVDSGPEAGACAGDSGGPALRHSDATWELTGTLNKGSPGCTGVDQYVDLSSAQARDWLRDNLPPSPF